MGKTKVHFGKDFVMVIIGQIISLFGNNILRFALPLYLLDQTGSAALFGIVSACSFVPMILLSPVGGILADRVNKRNIMVILDFATSILALIYTLLLGHIDIVVLSLVVLIILYGIQGAYSPAVQASIPSLVNVDSIMPANAAVNLVSAFAQLIGPVVGGVLYAAFGVRPIVIISIGCFVASAVMEIFINIPYKKQKSDKSIISIAVSDMKDSFKYIKHDQPKLWQMCVLFALINLFVASLIIIGLPIVVKHSLGFSQNRGNLLYGYAMAGLALGGLGGGLIAGTIGTKLNAEKLHILLYICTCALVPIGLVLAFSPYRYLSYAVIVLCCFVMMMCASVFSIQMMGYLQIITPINLVGKIISCALGISMCASPLGQALYGGLFEGLKHKEYIIFFSVSIIALVISVSSQKALKGINKVISDARSMKQDDIEY